MRNDEAVALLARLELDRHAYGELLASMGAKTVLVAGADAAGLAALRMSAATVVVVVADDAEPTLISRFEALRLDMPTLQVVVIIRDSAFGEWEGVADAIVPRRGDVAQLRVVLELLPRGPAPAGAVGTAILRERYTQLTKTEAELLPLLASGLTLRDAAQVLAISYKTADNNRTRLFRKLGLRDRVQLARFAIREGIIPA